MNHSLIDLVTVSREYGAGGSEFAHALGERLGWRVFDREIIGLVAERLRLDRGIVESLDEHTPSFLSRVAQTLMIAPIESPMLVDTSGLLSPDAVAEAAHAALLEAAAVPPVIIVGHAGQAIFANRPNTLHVRLVAPVAARVERICRRIRCDEHAAAMTLRRMDQGRESYVRRYYHIEWRDPLLYDVQFDTGRIDILDAVTMTAALGRFLPGTPGSPAPPWGAELPH